MSCPPTRARPATCSRRRGRLAQVLLSFLLAAAMWSSSALGERWTVQSAAGPAGASDAALTSISCTSATSCVAVGSDSDGWNGDGTAVVDPGAFAEALQGANWSPDAVAQPPVGSPTLDSVSCVSTEFCVAVGASTLSEPNAPPTVAPLAEAWNGATWQPQEAVGANEGKLTSVSCVSNAFCMAVGYFNAASSTGSLLDRALVETWDGEQWQMLGPARLPGVQYSVLNAVSCVGPDACTAAGGYFPGGASTLSFNQEVPLAEGWDGTRWVREAIPGTIDRQVMRANHYVAFDAISCTASDACLAAGSGHAEQGPGEPLAETLRGGRWMGTPRLTGSLDGGEISGVSCLSASQCVVVGTLDPHAFENAIGGFHLTWKTEVLAKDWNGKSWSSDAVSVRSGTSSMNSSLSPSAPAFGGVSCATGGTCFAVGARRAGPHSAVLAARAPGG